jgi:aminodeoxyfutalosine deaminase
LSFPAFLRALPKVELHVHLVGSASVPTIARLAARHGAASGVPSDPGELAAFYRFRDFPHFLDVYDAVNALVSTPADVTDLVTGLTRDLATHGVRYAEVTVTPYSHVRAGIDPAAVAEALTAGREIARTQHGVDLAWIFDTAGEFGGEYAWETLRWVLEHRPEGTIGFGLGGPEIGVARGEFTAQFAAARAEGLHSLPHAGETTGPETVWAALRELRAERIGHGIGAVGDPDLVAHLARERIPLEVCPTSNVCTGAVGSLDDHPFARLLRAGVAVTLNTDDPGMFGCDLTGEYLVAHERFGLSAAELVGVARTGVEASFCPEPLRGRLLAELDAAEPPA